MELYTWWQVKDALHSPDIETRKKAESIAGDRLQELRLAQKRQIKEHSIRRPLKIKPKKIVNPNAKHVPSRSHSSTKSVRNLAITIASQFTEEVTKETFISYKPKHNYHWSNYPNNWKDVLIVCQDRDDNWWNTLLSTLNREIIENIQKQAQEDKALEELRRMIADDEFLRDYNIGIRELVKYGKNYYVIKVYLASGAGFLEGSLKELCEQLREIIENSDIEVETRCPICTKREIRFSGNIGLCLICGTMYNVDTGDVLKKYDEAEKHLWVAKSLVDPVMNRAIPDN